MEQKNVLHLMEIGAKNYHNTEALVERMETAVAKRIAKGLAVDFVKLSKSRDMKTLAKMCCEIVRDIDHVTPSKKDVEDFRVAMAQKIADEAWYIADYWR